MKPKKSLRRLLPLPAVLLLSVLMLCSARAAVCGALDGLRLSGFTVIPSLFPFFVLSNLLLQLGLGAVLSRPLRKIFQALFGVSAAGATAFLFGLLGGYPLGAKTVVSLYKQREVSQRDAERLFLFCNNTGPSFFVGAVGVALFGRATVGLALYAIHLLGAVCTGFLLSCVRPQPRSAYHVTPEPAAAPAFGQAFSAAVLAACQSMLSISAFVVFFSALLAVLRATGVIGFLTGLLPGAASRWQALLLGCVEITSGVAALAEQPPAAAFCLASVLVSFGGMCVHFQAMAQCAGTPLRPVGYLGSKLLHAVISGLLAIPVAGLLFPPSGQVQSPKAALYRLIPVVFLIILLFSAKILQKRGGIYRRNPV